MIINFIPSNTVAFQFQAFLDGTQYTCVVSYNFAGQRYYVNVYSSSGALVACVPMIDSPQNYNNNILDGYFKSTLIYRINNQQLEISP